MPTPEQMIAEHRFRAKILPCPFCGKEPVTLGSGEGQRGLMIQCDTPGCVNPHVSYYNHQVAMSVWNMRAALDAPKST